MISLQTARVQGQTSFLLQTPTIRLAVTRSGGMLGPVTFFPNDPVPVEPYAIAPWAEEEMSPGTPPMLRALRGDWFCSAFGENAAEHRGRRLPPHGETANGDWHPLAADQTRDGCWLRLGMDLKLQGGRCEATTALLHDQSIVYQRHDLLGIDGSCNPGHHATLSFPNVQGAARLSFSRFIQARTCFEPAVRPDQRGHSALEPDVEIRDLHAVPCADGSSTDLCCYPARRGFEDIAILCADPARDLAWSAVTLPGAGYAWFALRDPRQLASTLLWFSNGGRLFPPWNGRHVNVMGIEDITAFFHVGAAESCGENPLNRRGIRTSLEPDANGRLSIPYIQGVARIPSGFDRVARIEAAPDGASLVLHADSGAAVAIGCQLDFLRSGKLRGLDFA